MENILDTRIRNGQDKIRVTRHRCQDEDPRGESLDVMKEEVLGLFQEFVEKGQREYLEAEDILLGTPLRVWQLRYFLVHIHELLGEVPRKRVLLNILFILFCL